MRVGTGCGLNECTASGDSIGCMIDMMGDGPTSARDAMLQLMVKTRQIAGGSPGVQHSPAPGPEIRL
jgi:hypothetical protein